MTNWTLYDDKDTPVGELDRDNSLEITRGCRAVKVCKETGLGTLTCAFEATRQLYAGDTLTVVFPIKSLITLEAGT